VFKLQVSCFVAYSGLGRLAVIHMLCACLWYRMYVCGVDLFVSGLDCVNSRQSGVVGCLLLRIDA
jgi:hypothetical protein